MPNLVCDDPLHATRSGEPDFVALLGTGSVAVPGLRCPACKRLGVIAQEIARTSFPVIGHRMRRLGAGVSSTVTALADVPGLAFELKPHTHYAFRFVGAYTAAAGTTGLALAVNGPASPLVLGVIGMIAESATAFRTGVGIAYDTPLTGANSGGATRLPFWVEGNISTNSAGGTFVLRFASEVGGSAVTILAGSMGELKEVAG